MVGERATPVGVPIATRSARRLSGLCLVSQFLRYGLVQRKVCFCFVLFCFVMFCFLYFCIFVFL